MGLQGISASATIRGHNLKRHIIRQNKAEDGGDNEYKKLCFVLPRHPIQLPCIAPECSHKRLHGATHAESLKSLCGTRMQPYPDVGSGQ